MLRQNRHLMNRFRIRSNIVAGLLLVACTAGAAPPLADSVPCAVRETLPAATGTPAALATEITWVGSQPIEYWVHRATRPRATLVFENGLMLQLTTWQRVVQLVADEADIVLYNRPGIGRSGAPEQPQGATHTVGLLHELLRTQNLPAPYILVGHSMGGQYSQLFARQYASEVSAMLLVDALPPGTFKPHSEFPWYTQLGLRLFAPAAVQREIADAHEMGELLLRENGPFDKPMIRLVASPDPAAGKPEGLLKDLLKGVIYAEDFGVWAVDPDIAEQRLDQLYPHSVVRRLRAHHRMQEEAPDAVVEALRELMAGAGCMPSGASIEGGRSARHGILRAEPDRGNPDEEKPPDKAA